MFLQVVVHEGGGNDFSLCHDGFLLQGIKVFINKGTEIGEDGLHEFLSLVLVIFRVVEFANGHQVIEFQILYRRQGFLTIVPVEVVRDVNQRVGGSRHGGEYHDFGLLVRDELCHFFDSRSATDRGASKFQYIHNVLFLFYPFIFSHEKSPCNHTGFFVSFFSQQYVSLQRAFACTSSYVYICLYFESSYYFCVFTMQILHIEFEKTRPC